MNQKKKGMIIGCEVCLTDYFGKLIEMWDVVQITSRCEEENHVFFNERMMTFTTGKCAEQTR